MLITLLLTALIMQLLSASLLTMKTHLTYIQEDKTTEWFSFTALLTSELTRYYNVQDVSAHQINITSIKAPHERFNIRLFNHKIMKRPGHHPYLYQVKNWEVQYDAPYLFLSVIFDNNQQFETTIIVDHDATSTALNAPS